MGLLDVFLKGTGDPEKDAVINRGLLQAGLALMQSRGKLFPALGQAGMQGLQAADQMRMQQAQQRRGGLQDQVLRNQLAEQQRQQEIAALGQQFYRAPSSPVVDPIGSMETAVEAPNNASGMGGFDMQGYIQALMARAPQQALALQQATQRQRPSLMNVAPGGSVFDPETQRPVYTAPFKPAEQQSTTLARLLAEREQLPPNDPRRAAYDDAIKKETTASAGLSVSFGTPTVGINPATGQPELVRPDSRGGMQFTGVAPAKTDKPMTEAQAKAATFKSQMEAAERELKNVPLDMSKLWNQADVGIAGGMTNIAASPAAQRARQAQEQWAESFLRFKTGAAATKDEVILNVRTFFPQPGDKKEVIEQKARMREQAVKDISFAATGKPAEPTQPSGLPSLSDIEAELARRRGAK
jgi:hypothetical protein